MFSRLLKGCLVVIILAALGLFLVGRPLVSRQIADKMYPYTSFDSDPVIAQLTVSKTGTSIRWNVQLFTYISSDQPPIDHSPSQPESCDQWKLKADVMSIQSWLATGVPAGWYILTTLEGIHCLNSHGVVDASIVRNLSIDRNTGPVTQDGAFGGLVSLKTLTSNIIHADGKTYDAILTQTSLSLIATD